MAKLDTGLPALNALLQSLGLPDSAIINKPLFKKMFQEHAELDAKDKQLLKDAVCKIRWLYSLKPSTINIAPYQDELHDYGEVALLHVELNTPKHAERIGLLLNRAIPYPLWLLFTYSEAVTIANEYQTVANAGNAADMAEPETSDDNIVTRP